VSDQRPLTRRLLPPLAALCATLAVTLAACGGSSGAKDAAKSAKGTQSTPSTSTQGTQTTAAASHSDAAAIVLPGGASAKQTVASVGSEAISAGEMRHWMASKSPNAPVPDPPQYAACIANLKETALKSAAPAQSESQLKQTCQGRYEEQLAAALGTAIHKRWLLGEAREEGIGVSDGEVQREFELSKKSSFKTDAEFEAYLKHVGQDLAEFKAEIKLSKLTDRIFQKINRKAAAASSAGVSAKVSSYYATHKQQFSVAAGRRVLIIRTATEASALKAKQELQSGKSFASVAKELSAIGQPVTAKNGEIADLKPHLFQEKVLDDAIFSAKPNRLYGPVELTAAHKTIAPETNSGFFVFEVKGIVPGRQIPLAEVKASLTEQLTKQQKEQSLAASIKAFRRKWTARTDCRPSFVIVKLCRQFKAPKGAVPEDPYTL
jgi:foldase protein PrsA